MRPGLLLALLAFASLSLAATPESFVQPYLQPGEYTYYHQVNYSSKSYYIVWVNATETFVLEQAGDSFLFLNHTPTIHGVILQDFLNHLDINSELATLNSNFAAFNGSRQPRQHDCEVLTGTDHAPCYDSDSCLQACLSVPACRAYNQPSGGALVNAVLAWQTSEAQMDANLTEYSQQVSLIAARSDQSDVAVSSAQTILDRVFPPLDAIRANKLFNSCHDCFNYCYPIPFNTSILNSSHAALGQISAKMAPMGTFPAIADDIQRRTYARINTGRFSAMLYNMTATEQSLAGRAADVARMRDPAIAANLTQLGQIISQVNAYGDAQDYEPAFALEPQFYLIALQLSARIASEKATLDRYDGMMANITASRFNITANANHALALINDTGLRASITKMENITLQMEILANETNFTGAFELEDDYWWEAGKAQSAITNVSGTYSEISRSQREVASLLNSTGAKIRANETEFRQEFANLSATYDMTMRSMGPPIQPADAAGIRANFTSLAQGLEGLGDRIDAAHEREVKDACSAQLRDIVRFLFSDGFPRIR